MSHLLTGTIQAVADKAFSLGLFNRVGQYGWGAWEVRLWLRMAILCQYMVLHQYWSRINTCSSGDKDLGAGSWVVVVLFRCSMFSVCAYLVCMTGVGSWSLSRFVAIGVFSSPVHVNWLERISLIMHVFPGDSLGREQ